MTSALYTNFKEPTSLQHLLFHSKGQALLSYSFNVNHVQTLAGRSAQPRLTRAVERDTKENCINGNF